MLTNVSMLLCVISTMSNGAQSTLLQCERVPAQTAASPSCRRSRCVYIDVFVTHPTASSSLPVYNPSIVHARGLARLCLRRPPI